MRRTSVHTSFLRNFAHHIYLQVTLCTEALESHIFLLQLAVALTPGIYRLLTSCVTFRNIRCRASIGPVQNLDRLVFGESAISRGSRYSPSRTIFSRN